MNILKAFTSTRAVPPKGAVSSVTLSKKTGASVDACRRWLGRQGFDSGMFTVRGARTRYYWPKK